MSKKTQAGLLHFLTGGEYDHACFIKKKMKMKDVKYIGDFQFYERIIDIYEYSQLKVTNPKNQYTGECIEIGLFFFW